MDPITVGALIGGGVQTAQGLFNIGQAKKQRQFQREMSEYAWNKDVEMWNMQNAYNSPLQQMERLKSAGLNPNLVYGSGSVVGNTTGAIPKYQRYETPVAKLDLPNILGVLSTYQDLRIKKGQEESIKQNNAWRDVLLSETAIGKKYKNLFDEIMTGVNYQWNGNMTRGRIGKVETGSADDNRNLFLEKYQADVKNRINSNELQRIQLDFYRTVPKEYQWAIPLLMRIIQ